MITVLKLLALSSILAIGAAALADDSPNTQTRKQKMQECMNRQRTSNSGLSDHDMKKACTKELDAADHRPAIPPSPALVPGK
jgi:hypothetical protein